MLEKVTLKTYDGLTIIGDHYRILTPSAGVLLLHMMPATKESYKEFKVTLEVIVKKLDKEIKTNKTGEGHNKRLYAPGFLDRNDEDRKKIDKQYDTL